MFLFIGAGSMINVNNDGKVTTLTPQCPYIRGNLAQPRILREYRARVKSDVQEMLLKLRNAEAVQTTSRHCEKGLEQILLTARRRNQLCQHLELLTSAFQSWETIKFGCLSHPVRGMSYYAKKGMILLYIVEFSIGPQHFFFSVGC